MKTSMVAERSEPRGAGRSGEIRAHIGRSASLEPFVSPVTVLNWTDTEKFNRDLRELVHAEMKSSRGIRISNAGGWHSEYELFERNEPVVAELKRMIVRALEVYYDTQGLALPVDFHECWEIQAWANVNRKGSKNLSHDHTKESNQWSGIYYLETGHAAGERMTGETVFEDRHYAGDGYVVNRVPVVKLDGHARPREVVMTPEPSKMCLFPGTLWHRVETYLGERERITIAFNMKNPHLAMYRFGDGRSSRLSKFLWYNFRGPMRALAYVRKRIGSGR